MAEIRFPKIEIEPADLSRLETIIQRFEEAVKKADGWQKTLHERDDDILELNNVISLQEKLLREQRENMKALYEERDALRQRLSEAEDDLTVSDMFEKFEPGTTINIKVMLPGQYIVGWKQGDTQYVPGISSYYPLSEAVDKAVTNYQGTKANTPQSCQWTESPDTMAYTTECGGWYNLDVGLPSENGMKFCPYCGRHIVEVGHSPDCGCSDCRTKYDSEEQEL